ncbi:MAG: hypothetical protein JKY67_20560 [Pseudomonadales bacterium]|nr:hypothetical protein [Pseudomonadales bacterium]
MELIVTDRPTGAPNKGVQLSRVSKLGGIRSWSLPALETCPGAKTDDGLDLVDVCKGCYARAGHYRFPNVKKVRAYNKLDWQRDDWVDRMVLALDADRYLRWLDSGDIYSRLLAEKIFDVVSRTPWVKHWIPTRSHKVPKIKSVLDRVNQLDNAVVRYSSDSIDGRFSSYHGSVVIADSADLPEGATLCSAYVSGRCNGCRQCWDKSVAVVAYVAHGRAMKKLVRRIKSASACGDIL